MKILINTLTPSDIAVIAEKEDFSGIIDIHGELFIPGEWKHVPDDLDTSAYSFIKEVSTYLQARTKQLLEEQGLNNFAKGVEESYALYTKASPPIATDILKYAPTTKGVIK